MITATSDQNGLALPAVSNYTADAALVVGGGGGRGRRLTIPGVVSRVVGGEGGTNLMLNINLIPFLDSVAFA